MASQDQEEQRAKICGKGLLKAPIGEKAEGSHTLEPEEETKKLPEARLESAPANRAKKTDIEFGGGVPRENEHLVLEKSLFFPWGGSCQNPNRSSTQGVENKEGRDNLQVLGGRGEGENVSVVKSFILKSRKHVEDWEACPNTKKGGKEVNYLLC